MTFVRLRLRRWWTVISFGAEHPARRLAALTAFGVVSGFGEAAAVMLVVAIVSRGEPQRLALIDWLPSSTWTLAAAALAVLAVLAAAHIGSAVVAARAGVQVQRNVQTWLVSAYFDAPWPVQAASPIGQLQEYVTGKASILAHGAQEAAQGLSAALNLAVVVVAATIVSPWAMLALLAAVALVMLLSQPARRRRRTLLRRSIAGATDFATHVTDSAMSARDLRVFGVSRAARERLIGVIDRLAELNKAVRTLQVATGPLTRDVTVAVVVIGLAVVVSSTAVGLTALGSTVVLMLRALSHGQSLSNVGNLLAEREQNLERVEAMLREWRPETAAGHRPCARVERLELRGVSYRYPGSEEPALADVDLELRRGEQLGIVGRTGAGKSTLASVLLGLAPPDAGEMLVDGVPLAEIDPADWHARTAWVGQEPRLLTGTVAENIRFLRHGLDDDAVLAAARAAGLDPELGRWPEGIDHPVGPAGSALSGGQRQRVALARALAGRPDLLVLDEPTSALDAHAEAAIRDAIEAVRHDVIVVVIAHRLSTVQACDRLAIVADGRIAALGSPDQLATTNAYLSEVVALSRR